MAETLRDKSVFLDAIQVAFFLTDAHAKILYANQQVEPLVGYKREEMQGRRIRTLFLAEDLTYFLPNIIYLTLYEKGFEGEALLRQKNGKRIFVHLTTTSFKEGGEVFLTFSFQEIQRLKHIEQERLEGERWASVGRMVEEIAYQVRNPVVSIGRFARSLLKCFSSSRKGKSYLEQILREANRLETIISRVEEYVRIPRPSFKKEMVEEVVQESLRSLSQIAGRIPIIAETKGFVKDRHFFVDRGLVTAILCHLVENSLEAVKLSSRKRGPEPIGIVLSEDDGNVVIVISDKGLGILKRHLPFLFEPFFSTRPDRVGLGLTFVKKAMEEHGGRIQVKSQWKRGTTVTLSFPKDRRRRIRREWVSAEAIKASEIAWQNG